MSAEAELREMEKAWCRALKRAGLRASVVAIKWAPPDDGLVGPASWSTTWSCTLTVHGVAAGVWAGDPTVTILAVSDMPSEEAAYAALLRAYAAGKAVRLSRDMLRFFPPCSSAEELELRLAVSGAGEGGE